MSGFSIAFVPPIESKGASGLTVSLSELDVQHINAAYKTVHRIEYIVGEEVFTYYAASILTILNDIELEYQLIRKRQNHDMTLSGYTVLYIEFQDQTVNLIDPVAQDVNGREKLVGNFPASEIETAFHKALELVYGFIQNL